MIPCTSLLAAALTAVPCEYVIDMGGEAVPFAYKMLVTLDARDGTRLEDLDVTFSANTDPAGNRGDMVVFLRDHGWTVRSGPGSSLVVTGSAMGNKSPIKSVRITSEKAIPVTVRWVPLPPEKKK